MCVNVGVVGVCREVGEGGKDKTKVMYRHLFSDWVNHSSNYFSHYLT